MMTGFRTRVSAAALALGLSAACVAASTAPAGAAGGATLNVLAWCDFTDPDVLQPFERAHDVTVNVKTFEGTPAALSVLSQSRPGDWDVLNVEGADIPRLVRSGLFQPLSAGTVPIDDIFPWLLKNDFHVQDGVTYGAAVKYGYVAFAYDRTKVDPATLTDMSDLWTGRFKGRIAVYDIATGIVSLVAKGLGKSPEHLTPEDMPAIEDTLRRFKERVTLVGDIPTVQTALVSGDVDVVVGGGEWLTIPLADQNPDLVWSFPEQGAVRWGTSLAVLKDASSPDLAQAFVAYMLAPEAQAALATSDCYWGYPVNRKAADHLSDDAKARFQWDRIPQLLAGTEWTVETDDAIDPLIMTLWTRFLQW